MTNGAPSKPPEPKWLMYLLSFLFPIVGLILGIIYWSKPEEENKAFGKKCILWMVIGIVLWIVCWIVYALVIAATFFHAASTIPTTY
jgi:prepilin signal peptidase PulO-like enzyme (type II secretory pathway)